MNLTVDPKRDGENHTGIYVRAQTSDGRFVSADLSHLTRDSVVTWLRSRGGQNVFAENCVLVMLGHEPLEETQTQVYLWCFGRKQWWKPNERDYTDHLAEAGQYPLGRALEICDRANIIRVQEAIVPAHSLWETSGRPTQPPGTPE